jgi:alkyl sulfatase BDS1-like metallo-beta-lactamase superfamily hydrolase
MRAGDATLGEILELSERAWGGDLSQTNLHMSRTFVGFEEFDDGLGFLSAFSNAAVIESSDGLVFLDTSGPFHAAKFHELVRAWSSAPVHTAVYTHGHVDHVFGLGPFEQEASERGLPKPHVIAHEACSRRFDRYRLTAGYNGVINQRQFNLPRPAFPTEFRYPDESLQGDRVLEVGGEVIELHHDRGETDDHLWMWMPRLKTLYTGDLFIWASPNCGNPQKAQRYPREWAQALRKMSKLGAERLFPGHGPPILGAGRIDQALGDSAELLETLVEQTLAMMNDGAALNDILHSVTLPDRLLERPYLRPVYDDPLFIVNNLWRLYGGWYDGNPAHLRPARDLDLARAIAAASGGARALAQSAEDLFAAGDLDVASHLIEFAAQADAADPGIRNIRAQIYERRAELETSLMAKGIFGAAARESGKDES